MVLKITKPDGKIVTMRLNVEITGKAVTIGRDAQVKTDDLECSRIHCAIRYWDDIYVIRDMKSHNGTFLNGQRITVAELRPTDVVKIGKTQFTFESEGRKSDLTLTGVNVADLKKETPT